MATLLREIEGTPESWPTVILHYPARVPDGGGGGESLPTVDAATVWRRIEAWIGHRWASRPVSWVLEGPGEFEPRLQPFTLVSIEQWDDAAGWVEATAAPSALGYCLAEGRYRITGTAGDDSTPPETVQEAFRRLHEYASGIAQHRGARMADTVADDRTRPTAWAARAMNLSGAADLLRPWRRLGAG